MFPPIAQLHFLHINPRTTHNFSIGSDERVYAQSVSFETLYVIIINTKTILLYSNTDAAPQFL